MMKLRYLLQQASLACLSALMAGTALAQTAAPTEAAEVQKLDEVTVGLVKDPAMLPYARMNELLGQLARVGQGLFRMDFKLSAKDPARPLQSPKLAVLTDERNLPIKPDAEGRFELPVLPTAEAKTAELATNQPKGSLAITGQLHLTVPADKLDMATVRRVMAVAKQARNELLPWYLRWLFPQVGGVRVCSTQPRWELEWREAGQLLSVPLSADAKDRDPNAPAGKPGNPCATLTGEESWPDAARLVAPADARLSVRLARSRQGS
ncbi:hypothetical protein [Roseateles sp.]|jgi:hypothetical protein|uniref:hypothetical protein n=1 Tax=Roseateles sp. TaxID=1971397 RepID=UPI0037C8892A